MINQLVSRIRLFFYPPKKGDVFYGNSFDFIVGKPWEYILHGMRDIHGESVWLAIPGDETYILTIESDVMPYYICQAQVLASNPEGDDKVWLPRHNERRIWKKDFKKAIIENNLKKKDVIYLK